MKDVSFSIEKGEMVGFIGPNGAGKSTTIKMLSGILCPDKGSIVVNGYVPYRQRKAYVAGIGVVFGQKSQLQWDLPVIDSFELLKAIYRIPEEKYRKNLDRFLEMLDMGSFVNQPVRQLSLGQRMRADIVAALLHSPQIVFFDEPTIGVDVLGKETIREFIRELNAQDEVTMLFTTHDMQDIEKTCKRLIIIDKGAKMYDGTLQEIREKYQRRFRYVMVDEYQDTNGAQYQITKLLAGGYRNLCVVGDADQSIYGWRGADIRNILNFEQDYPDARTIMLVQNYRSTKNILAAANAVIENNVNRKPKELWTRNPEGEKIVTYLASDERDEASFIVKSAIKHKELFNTPYGNMAVLYRTNVQSRAIEDAFMQMGVPYTMVGGLRFYDRKEIKDITAYLKLVYNPMDSISLRRIINVPKRGLGDTSMNKVEMYAVEHNLSLFEVIADPDAVNEIPGITARTRNPLLRFATFIMECVNQSDSLKVSELMEYILKESGYLDMLQEEKTEDNQSRIENLQEFISVAREFEKSDETADLEGFLSNVALVSDLDTNEMGDDQVTLMTLHSAKGLEFPIVFMAGLEECFLIPGLSWSQRKLRRNAVPAM